MFKKDSNAWKLATRYARRKGVNSVPVELLPDGSVKFQSLIRGNFWVRTEAELKSLVEPTPILYRL